MKFYLTTPIYYVNDKPHIGSAYTTIAADVLARYRAQQGDNVHFLTGTAEHGTKMANYAKAAHKSPQEFVDQQSAKFKSAWQKLNINYSDFIRTTEDRHEQAVIKFFEQLKKSGKIYQAEYQGLYCVGHEAFIKESELDESGLCPDHKKPPEKITETNWFFKLSEYAPLLKQKITSNEFNINPTSRRNEVLAFIDQGLEDISISRQNVSWAIPLPWDSTQTIYVWLDELFNYCSAIGYGEDQAKFNQWWPADLHLIGKDIIKFHCIIWPALLLAIGEAIPKHVFAHGYFTVDGQKMSKTLGNVVDPVELVEAYNADVVRYFLLREIPFGSDGDFSHDRLKERYNSDLANGLGNLVSRTLNMIERFTSNGEIVPARQPKSWRRLEGELEGPAFAEATAGQAAGALLDLSSHHQQFTTHMQNLSLDKALATIWEQIALADRLIDETKPWQLAKDTANQPQLNQILSALYQALVTINSQLAPFMPETHQKLTALLQSQPIKKPSQPLFARK